MYRKILWFYIVILTLLDISLNSVLTAHGKYHGKIDHNVSLQEPLVDELHIQDVAGGGAGVALWPRRLQFGRAAVSAPQRRQVTLRNTANTTLHLYSISGKSPHFYASFFESKELEPETNTTFTVVAMALREGPIADQLLLHTSLGTLRYWVGAEGVSSEWEVWPVSLQVPHNATITHQLTLRNPTPQPVQVVEVYSSAPWLGLALAVPAAWLLAPLAAAPLVTMHVALPPAAPGAPHAQRTRVAFIRIRTNVTGGGGGLGADGSLVVGVEATPGPQGPHATPPHVRLRAKGSGDPPDTFQILVGNSGDSVRLGEAVVWGARCAAEWGEGAPPAGHNGAPRPAPSPGVSALSLRPHIPPNAEPLPAANLTLNYGEMWSVFSAEGGGGAARCWGWVRAAGALLPYSLTLYPGTLTIHPPHLHFVTSPTARADLSAGRVAEVRARNDFAMALRLLRVHAAASAQPHLVLEDLAPLLLLPGQEALVATVRLRPESLSASPPLTLDSHLTIHTNVSQYHVRLLVFEGTLRFEWDWPAWNSSTLDLGVVGTWQTVAVRGVLLNPGAAAVCVARLQHTPPVATALMLPCAHYMAPGDDHPCRCICAGCGAGVEVRAVAGARGGAARGSLAAPSPHGPARVAVTLTAAPGRLAVPPLAMPLAAPYAWSESALVVNSSMALRMRLLNVTSGAPLGVLHYVGSDSEVISGVRGVGTLQHRPEMGCRPTCYTGLPPHTTEGLAWEANLTRSDWDTLSAQAALTVWRAALFERLEREERVPLEVRTSGVVRARSHATLRRHWPALCAGPFPAARAPVGGAAPLRLACRNPSRSHALLLRPAIGPRLTLPYVAKTDAGACLREQCVYSDSAFRVAGWRGGGVTEWGARGEGGAALLPPALLLPPAAILHIDVTFSPQEPAPLTAYLYIRNNLTVMEGIQLSGRGVFPSFELGGRRPGALQRPLVLEAADCGARGEGAARLTLLARNTGAVPVRLRDWRLAGPACTARGFALAPCAPLLLAPNESRPLTLTFTPDWTVSRAAAVLELRSDLGLHRVPLRARVPAPLLPRCAARVPRPALEGPVRAAAAVLVVVLLVLVLAAGALDGERVLRRARAARQAGGVRAALDLRALAQPSAPPPVAPRVPPPPPPRRRRARRLDPLAESRAFERWRAALRRTDDDDRSSEDADVSEERDSPPRAIASLSPASPPVRRDSDDGLPDLAEDDVTPDDRVDEDGEETGSASSTPPEPNDDDPDSEDHASGGDDAARDSPVDRECVGPSPADDALRICGPIGDGHSKRPRRSDGDTPRRGERKNVDGETVPRRGSSKPHGRKDKPAKRRNAAPPTPLLGCPAAPPASPPPPAAMSGGVRQGATWSSVVARSALAPASPPPLPPIGSDVRRRADPAPPPLRPPITDDSLFYFNGALERTQPTAASPLGPVPRPDSDFTWHSGGEYAAPARGLFPAEEGAFGAMGSVWGADGRGGWGWPPGGVRPPPGFAPRPVRPYDPFQSLASIWTRGALDWGRPDESRPDDP